MKDILKDRSNTVLLLQVTCFLLFAGRAWQHLVWDAPLRSFFWDQQLLEGPIAWLTGKTWFEYATSDFQNSLVQGTKLAFGWFYLACAVLAVVIHAKRPWIGKVFLGATFCLILLALLYFKEKFYHVGQLFEYSSQVVTPVLMYLVLFTKTSTQRLLLLAKWAVALTFVCHALYDVGYYPQPGNFVDMMIRGFGMSEAVARTSLIWIGWVDIAIAVGLFIPVTFRLSIWYAIIWGLLTAFARVTTNFYIDFPWQSLNQWIPEMLFRMPHGLIPLVALLLHQSLLTEQGVVSKR